MQVGEGVARARLVSFAFGTSVLAIAVAGSPAAAQCVPNPTVANSTTLCSGTEVNGVVVATPGSDVIVAADATVTASNVAAVTIDVPLTYYGTNYESVSIAGHVQGLGTAGIVLNNGTVTDSGYYFGPTASLNLSISSGGVLEGTTALTLGQSSGNATGGAFATIDNAGTLSGTSGIALAVTNPDQSGFTSITNRDTGTIGAISGPIGVLDNAGVIDGGASSAVDAGTSYNPYLSSGASWTNSGTITSASTTATLRNITAPLINSGSIINTGTGAAIEGGENLTVTNGAGGVIAASGGTAISAGGGLTLVNAGTIDGDVTISPQFSWYSSTIDSTAGTINGDVTFGQGDNVLVAKYDGTSTLLTGITGRIDGGGGSNSVRIAPSQDMTINTAVSLPTGFQSLQLAPAAGTTVTLADGFVAPGTIALVGDGLSSGGAVVNDTTLHFTGQAFTSQIYNAPASFTNAGSIITTGGTQGVPALDLSGVTTFTNSGTIDVVGAGINLAVNGTTTNSGTITAIDTAVTAFDNVVTNSGTIRSTGGIGLAVSGNVGMPAYNSGLIEGATVGVSTSIDLTNSGTIIATNNDGTAVALDAYGSLLNEAGGVVGNGGTAVTASIFNSTVVNAGTINGDVLLSNVFSSAGQRYVALSGGVLNGNLSLGSGDLLVTNIVNAGPGAFAGINGNVNAAAGALLRYQVSSDASAILGPVGPFAFASYQLDNDATLNLSATGDVTRQLALAGTGTVILDASISTTDEPAILSTSVVSAPGQNSTPTQLDITSSGDITVTRTANGYPGGAVYLGGSDSFTNNGTISVVDAQSYSPTAAVAGGAAVANNGTITLNGGIGVNYSAALVNTGMITQAVGGMAAQGVVGVAALDNSGTISVEGNAVGNSLYSYEPMSVVNRATGIIITTGAQSTAILANGALTLDNAGTISGATAIQATNGGGSIIRNTGTIHGDILLGWSASTVENGGLIDGALTFGAGDDQLILLPGSRITGTVDGGDGIDQVTLAGTGSGSFAGATNFEHLDVSSGDWTLTGASTFTDGTDIESGASLKGTAATLTGSIMDDGTLVVDQPSDATLAATLEGTGLLEKDGTGTLTVGTQRFTGATDVLSGTLLLNGTLPSAVSVENGATLGGSGEIAAATIRSGGTIAPASGGLTIDGDFAQESGSIYAATILPGSTSSRIAVAGAATIGSGATLAITRGPGDYQIGTNYLLLTAAGGITGSYTLSQTAMNGTELRLVASGSSLYADLVRTGQSLAALAVNRNQASVAAAFGALNAGNAAYAALTADPDDAAVRAGLSQLSGEVHASARTAMVHDAMLAEGAVLQRMQPSAAPAGLWGQFVGGHGENDGENGASDMKRDSYGGMGGYDIALGATMRAGLAGGYSHTQMTLSTLRDRARINAGHVLGYAGGTIGALQINVGVGYDWSKLSTSRNLAFAGFSDTDHAHYNGNVLHGFGELGYALPFSGGTVEPYIGGSALRVHTDRFAETGGDAALNGYRRSDWAEFSDVGLKIATPIVAGVSAHASAAWQHAYGTVQPGAVLSFGGSPAAFTINGANLSRDAITPTLDVAWQMTPSVRLSIGYAGMIGDAGSTSSGCLTLGVHF